MELFEGVNAASGVTGGFVATPDHPNQPKWYDDVDAVMASFPAGEAIWFRPDTVYTSAIDGRKVKIKEGKQWVYLEASDECAQVEPMELRPAGVLPTAEPALIEVPGVLDASKLPITAFMSEEALSAEVEWQTFHSDFNGEFGSYMNGELLILLDEVAITEAGIVIDMLTAGEFSMNLRGASLYDDVAKYADDVINLADDAARAGFNFTKKAAAHMDDAARMIPVQTLDDIITAPMHVLKDPQGTKALMYYSQMWKNGKLYNVEVLYDRALNTIMHFKYTQKAIGPLLSIPK